MIELLYAHGIPYPAKALKSEIFTIVRKLHGR